MKRTNLISRQSAGYRVGDPVPKNYRPFRDKRPDTRAVVCPVCQAELGQRCRNAAGIVISTPHVPRQRLAFRKFYAEQEQEGTTS